MSLPAANTPAQLDKKAYQGSDFNWGFTVTTNNTNVDLTNTFVEMTVKRQRGKNVPVLWKGNTTNGYVSVTSVNRVDINIPKAEMADLPAGSLVYEVDFSETGATYTYLTGQFIVGMEVDD
jgi:hypothetical protein